MPHLRVLVFDDKKVNRDIAKAQLATEYDLTVASTYDEAQSFISNNVYDIVLADLLVPASSQKLGSEGRKLAGQEMPLGVFIALLAAVKGSTFVAVLTDSNHHEHPASTCFDSFNEGETQPTSFQVNDAKFLLCNNRNWIEDFDPSDYTTPLEWNDENPNKVSGKNWKALLGYLLAE